MSKRPDELLNELIAKVENPSLETQEDVKQFYADWMELIWNYRVPSMLFDYYLPDIMVYRENGSNKHGIREIVREVTEMQAAFPDIKIRIGSMVCVGSKEEGFQLFATRYFNGTSLGYSQYGAPTGKKLEGDKCMSQDMIRLEKIDGRWKIVKEYTMMSARTIRVAMGGEYEL